jgi:hypothetical protein
MRQDLAITFTGMAYEASAYRQGASRDCPLV